MTSYILDGFVTTFDDAGRITAVEQTQLIFSETENDTGLFWYVSNSVDPVNLPFVNLRTSGFNQIAIPGYGLLYDYPGLYSDYELGQISWAGHTSYTLQVTHDRDTPQIYTFGLGGDPLPPVITVADAYSFNALVTAGTTAPDGSGFAPDDRIDISSLDGIRITEDDEFRARDGNTIHAGDGDDLIIITGDTAVIDGGDGNDLVQFYYYTGSQYSIEVIEGGLRFYDRWSDYSLINVEQFQFGDWPTLYSIADVRAANLDPSLDLTGTDDADTLSGGNNNDRLVGLAGNDLIEAGDGADTLNGGDGDDTLTGGATSDDLRDLVYAGTGNDHVDGGYGNDLIFGMEGNDNLVGGHGVDELQGQDGNDTLTGGAWSDLLYGGEGDDYLNGGFGFDRLNGGGGADRFFHLGVADHGSDWLQDFSHQQGDRLIFGQTGRAVTDFQVNFARTEGAGDSAIEEAFVIYRPTGQILWALVDGAGQTDLSLQLDGTLYTLL